eukprot:1552943-Prymnesium_polylepis.1
MLLTDLRRNPLSEWFRRDDWRQLGEHYVNRMEAINSRCRAPATGTRTRLWHARLLHAALAHAALAHAALAHVALAHAALAHAALAHVALAH